MKILFRSIRGFFKDSGVMLASYISFSFIMAVAPFCLLVVSALGYVLGGSEQLQGFLSERLSALFPRAAGDITAQLRKLITFRSIGKFSLIIYGALSFQLFSALQYSIDTVFKVAKKASFLRSLFFSLVVTTLIVVFLLVAFMFSWTVPLLRALRGYLPHLPWLEVSTVVGIVFEYILPFALVLTVAVMLYLLLPRKHIRFKNALWGGLFTALATEAAKHIFTWYVGSFAALGAVYGPLTTFVVFLLWVFYSSAIFLIGGEITHNLGGAE